MNSIQTSSTVTPFASQAEDADAVLLAQVVAAVRGAGEALKAIFNPAARPRNRQEVVDMIAANDQVSLAVLRKALAEARPQANWDEDEAGSGALPAGEWWVCDPVEGAINHIHGLSNWSVTATLVRDNVPVVTAVYLPMLGDLYTAVKGGGAQRNGQPLRASAKTELSAALASTGQAVPNEGSDTYRRIGQSINAMLENALVVQASVPATLQMIHIAAGSLDVFWQFSQVRSGLAAGALLVGEAGGAVTDIAGQPWQTGGVGFIASAPALSRAVVDVLSSIR